MDFDAISLTRQERKRFLKIARGDTRSTGAPTEDALIQKKLIKRTMFVTIKCKKKTSSVNISAVVLTNFGEEYYAKCRNLRKKDRRESCRFWVATLLSLAGLIVSIIFGMR